MPRKKPQTPYSQLHAAVMRLWVRSIERAAAIKRDRYTCQECGAKQSRRKGHEVKVEVHHLDQKRVDLIVESIYRNLLHEPHRLLTLCKPCHKRITEEQRAISKTNSLPE